MGELVQQSKRNSPWQRVRGWLLSKTAVRVYWFVNGALLISALAWILRDGKFAEGVAAFAKHVSAFVSDESPLAVVQPLMWPRVDWLWVGLIAGIASMAGILAGLFGGSGVHRGVRSWLVLTLLCAGWLTLLTTWPAIAKKGLVWRAMASVAEIDEISQELLADWPKQDGEFEGLGPYMAYPIARPRTLMLLKNPRVAGTSLSVSTIERGAEDDLHFQLTGNDDGVWIVRDLKVDEPRSFFSGLEGEYIPEQFAELQPGWFLVWYKYAPILPDTTPEMSVPRR